MLEFKKKTQSASFFIISNHKCVYKKLLSLNRLFLFIVNLKHVASKIKAFV